MHKAICTEVQGQTCVWQNTIMPNKFFNFLLFMCFWIFDTKQVKIDKKEQTFKVLKKQTKTVKTC